MKFMRSGINSIVLACSAIPGYFSQSDDSWKIVLNFINWIPVRLYSSRFETFSDTLHCPVGYPVAIIKRVCNGLVVLVQKREIDPHVSTPMHEMSQIPFLLSFASGFNLRKQPEDIPVIMTECVHRLIGKTMDFRDFKLLPVVLRKNPLCRSMHQSQRSKAFSLYPFAAPFTADMPIFKVLHLLYKSGISTTLLLKHRERVVPCRTFRTYKRYVASFRLNSSARPLQISSAR